MNVQFGTFTQFIKNLELAQWCCALYNENAKVNSLFLFIQRQAVKREKLDNGAPAESTLHKSPVSIICMHNLYYSFISMFKIKILF